MNKNTLSRICQGCGRYITRLFFTKSFLLSTTGKRLYLFLYLVYKKIFDGEELGGLSRYIRPGSTVVDIGANVGFTSVYFSNVVGASGLVLAFEPDPIAGEIFKYNLDRCHVNNVRLFQFAIGKRDGEAEFYQNPSNRADNRMNQDTVMAPNAIRMMVPIRSFSSIAQQNTELVKDVSFIKIDVQGYEMFVIEGMSDWLASVKEKPVLFIELWPYGLRKAGTSIVALLNAIEGLGYVVTFETRVNIARCDGRDDYQNFVFIPNGF
jgi:FkbM family methyltransferase